MSIRDLKLVCIDYGKYRGPQCDGNVGNEKIMGIMPWVHATYPTHCIQYPGFTLRITIFLLD